MIKRDGRGQSYCAARGEILGPAQDGRKRKLLPRMFSLIKNKSRRIEYDQISFAFALLTIQTRCSSARKRWRTAIRRRYSHDPPGSVRETTSLWVPGGVWLQSCNLKELTEGHHQQWSLRLNLTQHGKPHPARTRKGLTD